MAKIQFGGSVMDARGKLSGAVYSRNRSGAYLRVKVTPVNRNTSYQAAVRSSFGNLAKQWGTLLTSGQRANWVSYATTYPRRDIFGNNINLSGVNMFISLNQVILQTGNPIIDIPPASNVLHPATVDSFLADSVTPAFHFHQTSLTDVTGILWYVFSTPGLPPGRAAKKSDYRFIGSPSAPHTGSLPITIDLTADQATKFGPLIPGLNYNLLVATVDPTTGILSVSAPLTTVAT